MKYTKKRITIEAIRWMGSNLQEIDNFMGGSGHGFVANDETMFIYTLEGKMFATKGDYIIKEIQGEFYPCKPDIFAQTYDVAEKPEKSLGNTDSNGAKKNVKDIVFWGDGDTFILISKASSAEEGWMKSTKAMEIVGGGCVVQVTTQQRNPDGSYALTDSVTFVPDAIIQENTDDKGIVVGRYLASTK
jgi:hypothetical protein